MTRRLACEVTCLMRNSSNTPTALDRFDRAILAVLQKNSATPQRVIGEAVNLSAAAVQRRIKRMQEKGVIERQIAVIDPAAVGQPITLIVEVEIESERADLVQATKASFASLPNVQQCYYVTGEADFVLVVTAESIRAYEALTQRLFFDNQNVKRFRTLVVMDRVKVGLSIPISARPEPEKTNRSVR